MVLLHAVQYNSAGMCEVACDGRRVRGCSLCPDVVSSARYLLLYGDVWPVCSVVHTHDSYGASCLYIRQKQVHPCGSMSKEWKRLTRFLWIDAVCMLISTRFGPNSLLLFSVTSRSLSCFISWQLRVDVVNRWKAQNIWRRKRNQLSTLPIIKALWSANTLRSSIGFDNEDGVRAGYFRSVLPESADQVYFEEQRFPLPLPRMEHVSDRYVLDGSIALVFKHKSLCCRTGHIQLNRIDRRSQLKCLKDCQAMLEKRVPVVFFPEGTRSSDKKMLPFKKGAFTIAAKTDAPVIPITINGTGLPRIYAQFGDLGRLQATSCPKAENWNCATAAFVSSFIRESILEDAILQNSARKHRKWSHHL